MNVTLVFASSIVLVLASWLVLMPMSEFRRFFRPLRDAASAFGLACQRICGRLACSDSARASSPRAIAGALDEGKRFRSFGAGALSKDSDKPERGTLSLR